VRQRRVWAAKRVDSVVAMNPSYQTCRMHRPRSEADWNTLHNKHQPNVAKVEIIHIRSFTFTKRQKRFAIECFGEGFDANLLISWGIPVHHLTQCVTELHKLSPCQIASKSIKQFKQSARMQQMTGQQCGQVISNKRIRSCYLEQFFLRTENATRPHT